MSFPAASDDPPGDTGPGETEGEGILSLGAGETFVERIGSEVGVVKRERGLQLVRRTPEAIAMYILFWGIKRTSGRPSWQHWP